MGATRFETEVDLKRRKEQTIDFLNVVKRQFNNQNYSFSVRNDGGEGWMYVRRFKQNLLGFKVEDKSLSTRAKICDVLKAYNKIGQKSHTTSILQAMTQAQRDMNGVEVLLSLEAYAIARIIRIEDEARFQSLVNGV